jgi:hypothetical protein
MEKLNVKYVGWIASFLQLVEEKDRILCFRRLFKIVALSRKCPSCKPFIS